MSPSKKRRKFEANTSEALELTGETVDYLFEELEKDPESFDQWISISTLQQRMLQKIRQQEQELEAARASRKRQDQATMATQYEHDHLQRQIEEYRSYPLPNLEQLAREECRKEESIASEEDTPAEILKTFLQVDVNDPDQKDAITQKLQKCFEHRAELGKKIQVKRQALEKVQKELKSRNDFLSGLPIHIQALERASQGLVKFMQKNDQMHPLSGNDRLQRLQQAKNLPPAMYALFNMLQRAIDERSDLGIKIINDKVVLQFPLPSLEHRPLTAEGANDVAGNKNSRQLLSINFSYDGNQVKVDASGCSTAINQDVLLEELFEGDSSNDGSFCWANQLAGLHPVATPTVASTGLVLRELERRIHAYAILFHSLFLLQCGTLPTPPGIEPQVRKATFTKALDNTIQDIYEVKVDAAIGNIKVQIPPNQYPARPPVWTIPEEKNLENYLNLGILQELSEEEGPWLLVLQVRALLESVDNDKKAVVIRRRKGRERKLI